MNGGSRRSGSYGEKSEIQIGSTTVRPGAEGSFLVPAAGRVRIGLCVAEKPDLRAGSAAHGARTEAATAARLQQKAHRTAREIAHAPVPGAVPEESESGSAVAVTNLAFA